MAGQTQDHLELAYLTYAPNYTGQPSSYTSRFEQLGFKIDSTTKVKRDHCLDAVKGHVNSSHYKFLRSTDNAAAFNTMVTEFLEEHGGTYWGHSDRGHLEEPELSKGFLFPRDAGRPNSRYAPRQNGISCLITESRADLLRLWG